MRPAKEALGRGDRGVKSLAKCWAQTVYQTHSRFHKIRLFCKMRAEMCQVSILPQSTAGKAGNRPLVRSGAPSMRPTAKKC